MLEDKSLPAASSRRARAIAAAAFVIGASASASAAEPVRLSWVRGEGAEGCAAGKQIEERVTARLGEGVLSPAAGRSVEALVTRDEKGFRAVIYVRGATGTLAGSRELTSESESCASLEAASVLAIALAIDPDAALRPQASPSPRPDPAPSAPLPGATPPLAGTAPLGATPPLAGTAPLGATPPLGSTPLLPRTPFAVTSPLVSPLPPRSPPAPDIPGAGLFFRASPGLGLLPAAAAGLLLGGFVAVGAGFELTAEALWMPEVSASDRRFAFGLTAFSIGACRSLTRVGAFDFGACASVWGGALHAVVYDLVPEAPGDSPWAAASIAPKLRVRLAPHVHLDVGVHVLVPFVRRRYEIRDSPDAVFQQSPVTALPFLGGGVHFH